MIASNLKSLRKNRSETQEQVADAIGVNRSTYADYEKGKSEPSASLCIKIANYYSISVADLLTSELDAPLFNRKITDPPSLYQDGLRVVTVSVSGNGRENIELVPVSAIAGYADGYNMTSFIQDLPRFSIPNLPESTYRAFQISGNSMPPIAEGFIVVGKYVERWQDLQNGKRYVLLLRNEGIVFKRVVNEVGQNKKLVLFSDNPDFLPFTVSIADLLEAWEMVAFVGFPSEFGDPQEAILQKLNAIDQKINFVITQQG